MTPAAPLLRLEQVGKDYAKVDPRGGRMRLVWDLLRGRAASNSFRALDGVSFDLRQGESLGVIGENGAGKSTLLKIVAGVIQPTRGSIAVGGRIGALLELGSGFHPDYTGLANIDLAAALLGLTPAEIAAKRSEIIAFADIGEHIHEPIKHYSSGMVVRLGFAVAATLAPDILITDEVLAVGDESFQKKCVAWIERFIAGGGTLLLCSHSMYHVQKLCRHSIWLHGGKMQLYGPAADVTQAYLAYHEEKSAKKRPDLPAAVAGGYYVVTALRVSGPKADHPPRLEMGDELVVEGELYSPDDRPPAITVGVVRADGSPVYGVVSDMDGFVPARIAPQCYRFVLRFPALALLPGKYQVRAHAMDPEGMRMFDTVEEAFWVNGSTRELGLCRLPHQWHTQR